MNHTVSAVAFMASFALAFILYKIFIPVLRRVKLGVKILEVGPNWHKSKEGTPLMGGLFFITAMLLTVLAVYFGGGYGTVGAFFPINLCFVIINAAIGFIDDYVKLFKKRNRGLRARAKLFLQFAATGAYLGALKYFDLINTEIKFPFFTEYIDLGPLYYVFVTLIIIYVINCANLTDGLDGLAGSVAFVIAVLFFMIGARAGLEEMYITEAALCGALAAFLVFNFYPAKIIMGDTGSLFLGSMLVVCAMRIDSPALMLLIGVVYIVEGLSDIIQVAVFKLSGRKKRFFKMAPIHHHLELCNLSEVAIVGIFLAVTVAASVLSYFIYHAF